MLLVASRVSQIMGVLVNRVSSLMYFEFTSVTPWTRWSEPRASFMVTVRRPKSSKVVIFRIGPTATNRFPTVATRCFSMIRSRLPEGELTKLRTWYCEKKVRRIPSSAKWTNLFETSPAVFPEASGVSPMPPIFPGSPSTWTLFFNV